ncbi:MAG: ATP-dependent sacrificial sulfur transferase LarE, partial [Nitrospinaceae bacterium]|nr:ATP-dependent sacrificial sulfur transferase LarE [Nitrospinaceae bacterium]
MLLEKKRLDLESRIAELGSALVAFSGGVDSTLVLAVAKKVLGDKVLAVTAESDSVPERELQTAQHLAETLGVKHRIIHTEEMSSPDYLKNPANRCYYCKSELYGKLSKVAAEHKLTSILNGINLDDLGDHRPGITAANEAGIISPLAELGFNKQDVRDLAREMDLPNWEKPALACLSSRIPYGQPVTTEKLSMIEQAEGALLAEGFRQVRVRHHGDMARIELP